MVEEKRAYDNSRRRQRAILTSALRALEQGEPEEREKLPRRLRNVRKRRAKIPSDMRCPKCNELTTASKSWVVGAALKVGEPAQCKRCWAKHLEAQRQTASQQETADGRQA